MCSRNIQTGFSRLRIAGYLTAYGLGHALIDAICAGVLLTIWWCGDLAPAYVSWLFVYYNLLAFGAQPVLGALLDGIRAPRLGAVLGCLLTGAAMANFEAWPALSTAPQK